MNAILLFVFLQSTHFVYGQTVQELVQGIEQLEGQVGGWVYPENSDSYLDPNAPKSYKNDGTYDFIISGAGSAGSVLANRLSEIKKWKILLLEAGTWENDITDVPNMADELRTSIYNWGYHIVPQTDRLHGFLNNSLLLPRGKALGGCSVINAMIYARGNKDDFNKWCSLGNPGWCYDDVLPYFRKIENADFPNADPKYHGKGGNINVEYSSLFDEVGQAYLDGNVELGRKILDYSAEKQMGFSVLQLTELNGRRDSGGKGYINPARNRTNLTIFPETLVTKILINKNSKAAYGVEYLRNGTRHFARATKEVIVSAGAFNTPQLLMLSGIGPRKHLEEMNIPVVKDLPVGQGLWDHLMYNTQSFSINHNYPVEPLEQQVQEYLQGKGPLSTAGYIQTVGYVSVYDGTPEVPDVEHIMHASTVTPSTYDENKNIQRYTRETYESVVVPTYNISQVSIHSLLLHPKSKGTVKLKSNSPFDFPLIDPKYLTHPADVETLIGAIRDMMKMMNTSAMHKYNPEIIKVVHPNCANFTYDTHDFWACMVKTLADTLHHFGGTCKMGPKCDSTTVVNNNLQVHGVKKLRVIDCSVIPVTVSGHTNVPAYMIGEKGSDIIKEYYNEL